MGTTSTTICNLMNSIHFLKKGEARHFCLRDRVLKSALLSMFHPRVLSPPKATHMVTGCLTEVYKLFSRLFLFESFVSKKCRKLSIPAYQTHYGFIPNVLGRNSLFFCLPRGWGH